jgi:hypothetical protein
MDAYHLPLREIEARFTRSELAFAAWRSQEQVYLMHRNSRSKKGPEAPPPPRGPKSTEEMTSEEALHYFGKLGIFMPPQGVVSRN